MNIMDEIFRHCVEGNLSELKQLIQSHPDLDLMASDHFRKVLYEYACWKGHREILEYLVEELPGRVDLSSKGHEALLAAARLKHPEIVEYLLDQTHRTGQIIDLNKLKAGELEEIEKQCPKISSRIQIYKDTLDGGIFSSFDELAEASSKPARKSWLL